MNLQYEIRICHEIHNKGTMSQWQIQVTIFLSGTDVNSNSKAIVKVTKLQIVFSYSSYELKKKPEFAAIYILQKMRLLLHTKLKKFSNLLLYLAYS